MRPPIYEPRGWAREYAPLALNLWNTCSHGCKYCYVPQTMHKKPEDFHVAGPPREGLLEALEQQLLSDRDYSIRSNDRRVLLCFTCDPYQPHEDGFTRQVLEILVEYNVPFSVLTKGGMRAVRDFDLYAGGAGHFGTTACFASDQLRRDWEPGAATMQSRQEALATAHEQGIRTWVSIEPVIYPIEALRLIERRFDIVDEFRIGKLNHHPHAQTIDWAAFAWDALAALQDSGCDWRIKDDLFVYLPPGSPQCSEEASE